MAKKVAACIDAVAMTRSVCLSEFAYDPLECVPSTVLRVNRPGICGGSNL